MATIYTHRVTISVPESMIEKANHLAQIMGETAEDINTFKAALYEDANGNKYAVCSTVVTSNFISGASAGELPPSPTWAATANREWAAEVYASLGQSDGLRMAVDVDPTQAIATMGLSLPVESA